MDRAFAWVKWHAAELSFLIAGVAAIYAGYCMVAHILVPGVVTPIITTFGGIALQQINTRKKDASDVDNDDDSPPKHHHNTPSNVPGA